MAAAGLNESVLKQFYPLLYDKKLDRGRSQGWRTCSCYMLLILLPSWLRLAACIFKLSGCICIRLLLEWIFGISSCGWSRYRGNEHSFVAENLSFWAMRLRLNILLWIKTHGALRIHMPSRVLCPVVLGLFPV